MHQDPSTLYPGKGFVDKIGNGLGKGYSVNIPLPPYAGDAAYQYALIQVFVPLVEEFEPLLGAVK